MEIQKEEGETKIRIERRVKRKIRKIEAGERVIWKKKEYREVMIKGRKGRLKKEERRESKREGRKRERREGEKWQEKEEIRI